VRRGGGGEEKACEREEEGGEERAVGMVEGVGEQGEVEEQGGAVTLLGGRDDILPPIAQNEGEC
jgi:hypothetical protein